MIRFHSDPRDWHERKQERTDHFFRYVYGWRKYKCTACNGSGIYDHDGAPPCSACSGTGKEYRPGPKALVDQLGRYYEEVPNEQKHLFPIGAISECGVIR